MAEQVLHKCDFIEVTTDGDNYYIQSFKQGFSLDQFNKIVGQHPQIRVTSFTTIKSAIVFAPRPKEKFGERKEKITVEISPDGMKAFITLCVSQEELSHSKRESLKREILVKLNQEGIVYGIKNEVLLNMLENDKKILVAEGEMPENGKDCIIKMYEVKEAKPLIHADGSVDHYELNLINRVNKDEWLGERIDATPGKPGKNVKGMEIQPIPGKNLPLEYDKNSVYEVKEGNKTILYSKFIGAVDFKNGILGVSNHLEIDGNVDFSTGNIDFEGCVTIKGTIDDNFMVTADGDIEILGDLGIGSIRGLESRKGSIYIKGGISSKNKVTIRAAKNVFAKYVTNASVVAGQMVHVGYYCINADINAAEVLVDSSKGQIIGGTVYADARVVANTIGSPSEKRTLINVRGINKEKIKQRLEEINKILGSKKADQAQLKNDLNNASGKQANPRDVDALREKVAQITDEIKELEEEKKTLGGYLKMRGDGEIVIQKKIYPNCFIEIKSCSKEIHEAQNGITYYESENELKEA